LFEVINFKFLTISFKTLPSTFEARVINNFNF